MIQSWMLARSLIFFSGSRQQRQLQCSREFSFEHPSMTTLTGSETVSLYTNIPLRPKVRERTHFELSVLNVSRLQHSIPSQSFLLEEETFRTISFADECSPTYYLERILCADFYEVRKMVHIPYGMQQHFEGFFFIPVFI